MKNKIKKTIIYTIVLFIVFSFSAGTINIIEWNAFGIFFFYILLSVGMAYLILIDLFKK